MKILLTHAVLARNNFYGPRALAQLQALGDVRLNQTEEPFSPEGLIENARDADLIIVDRATAVPAQVFQQLPNLRAVLRCAVDIRNIDIKAASEAGVLVTQAKPGFVESVAELAIGFLVDLAKGVSRATEDFHQGRSPAEVMGRQLAGSTLGIIGFGRISRHLAVVAAAMKMKVLFADPYAETDDSRFAKVPLDALLAQSDHIVCLAVATQETHNLMDKAAFQKMKPDAVFVNLSRGELVDETALRKALTDGEIAAAALDVGRAPDQMPSPDIAALPNVIATPHIGGVTRPAIEVQAFDTVDQVRAIIDGEVPQGAVNSENWARR